MSNLIILALLVLVCIQAFYIIKANQKLTRYKTNIINKTEQLNRFHDIHALHFDFGWLTKPLFSYVIRGGKMEDLRDDILLNYETVKQDIVANTVRTISSNQININ